MGYSTEFTGALKFTKELTASQLAAVNAMLGEDCREHPEWELCEDLSYIDLALTDDFGGLRWSGAEKTYDLDQTVNVVIREMQKTCPDFGLTGELQAQGEDADDKWVLYIGSGGRAQKRIIPPTGSKVECPKCGHEFRVGRTHPDADTGADEGD